MIVDQKMQRKGIGYIVGSEPTVKGPIVGSVPIVVLP